VLGYAEDIFSIGSELETAVRDQARKDKPLKFRVGVADAVPKTIACRLIEPAAKLPEPVRIVCREWKLDTLLGELALHRFDLVIADVPSVKLTPSNASASRPGSTRPSRG
jgi:LysR family transcriptional regulator, transcriptional activator of nhaA